MVPNNNFGARQETRRESGGLIPGSLPLDGNKNLHFDNEQDNHTSSKNNEESGYNLDLDMPTILC